MSKSIQVLGKPVPHEQVKAVVDGMNLLSGARHVTVAEILANPSVLEKITKRAQDLQHVLGADKDYGLLFIKCWLEHFGPNFVA